MVFSKPLAISCKFMSENHDPFKVLKQVRNVNEIDIVASKKDLSQTQLYTQTALFASLTKYSSLKRVLDTHASTKEKCVTIGPNTSQYSSQL